jgi:hypothetical protein
MISLDDKNPAFGSMEEAMAFRAIDSLPAAFFFGN